MRASLSQQFLLGLPLIGPAGDHVPLPEPIAGVVIVQGQPWSQGPEIHSTATGREGVGEGRRGSPQPAAVTKESRWMLGRLGWQVSASVCLSGMRGVGPLLTGCQNGMKPFASLDAVFALMMTDKTQRQEQLQKAASRTGSRSPAAILLPRAPLVCVTL